MKKIAIEEHCFTQYFVDFLQSRKEFPRIESTLGERGQKTWRWWNSSQEYQTWLPAAVVSKICDIGEGRLKDMDEAGIDMQVISFSTTIDWLDAAEGTNMTKRVNDIFAHSVNMYPNRFAALAALYLKDSNAAADELERSVKQLGFKGAMVVPHVNGEFIDDKKYWPAFEKASQLNVPIYIHPTFPPPERLKQYSGYPELVGAMWGYGAETGLAAIRLICSGVFDQYPNLKIILGHMGEALPFWMSRLDQRLHSETSDSPVSDRERKETAGLTTLVEKLKKLPSQYIRDNFFVTTSGIFWQPVIQFVSSVLGTDKVLFAVDYPFESSKQGAQFIESLAMPDGDKERICHLNAQKLLRL
jgi:predicted TIM-barrel fold metal-dependent hydrolase